MRKLFGTRFANDEDGSLDIIIFLKFFIYVDAIALVTIDALISLGKTENLSK